MLLRFADWLTYELMGLSPESRWGGAVNFFVYDSVKILLLLFGMILVVGVLRSFVLEQKIRAWMTRRGAAGYVFAALFGAITPFCSCSSIPLFIGFISAGIPLGVTFSFLITSPLINEYLVVLMLGFFGWKITLAYVLSGLMIGITAGFILEKLKLESHLVHDIIEHRSHPAQERTYADFRARLHFGWTEAAGITKKVWLWVLVGVALGAAIHNYVPQESIQAILRKTGAFSVPIATLLGVPIYGSCAAIVPIAVVLFQKGIPLGTALSFMMATAALSLPEAVMLRRAMDLRLIAIFFAVTTLGIMVTGYLFNFLQGILI